MGHAEIDAHHACEGVDVLVHSQQHLHADEDEDDAQPVFQIGEILGNGGQCEIEGAEAEDGEDVGGEHDEGVAADAEDGRYAVDGEGYVGGLDDEKGDKQRRGLAVDKELVAVHLVGDGEEALEELHDDVLRRVAGLFVAVAEHLETGVEQEQSEESQNPLEALDHGGTGEDEDAAQDECTEDAPEEHFVLVLALNAEEGEEHEEDEEVIHRQRLLYEVARQKFHGLAVRVDGIEQVDGAAEQQRDAYPDGRHLQRLGNVDLMLSFLAEHLQVGNEHDEHQNIEHNPRPKGHSHQVHFRLFMKYGCKVTKCRAKNKTNRLFFLPRRSKFATFVAKLRNNCEL